MLYTFTEGYSEGNNNQVCHTYGEALAEITKQINLTCQEYHILHVYGNRVELVGDETGKPIYFEYACGEVVVLAEITPLSKFKDKYIKTYGLE